MHKNLRWKLLTIAVVTGLAIWSFTPPSQKVALGLDLKGGVHFVLEVKTDDALRLETETTLRAASGRAQGRGHSPSRRASIGLDSFAVEGVPPAIDQQFRPMADQQTHAVVRPREASGGGVYTFRMSRTSRSSGAPRR